jgi:hypothetical protein
VAKNSSEWHEQNGQTKSPWEPMQAEFLGDAARLVQGGGGKLTTNAGDPGETKKQKPTL